MVTDLLPNVYSRVVAASVKQANKVFMIQTLHRHRVGVGNLVIVCLISTITLCVLRVGRADDAAGSGKWVAPGAQAQKTNPIKADSGSIDAGRKIYMQRCAKCHGEKGEGDGPDAKELNLHPAKFTASSVREESDGALYWKITVGKKGMPDFGKRLSPNDRWNVINFVRTLGGH
jgi:mono/diheme cytochrome c family protein